MARRSSGSARARLFELFGDGAAVLAADLQEDPPAPVMGTIGAEHPLDPPGDDPMEGGSCETLHHRFHLLLVEDAAPDDVVTDLEEGIGGPLSDLSQRGVGGCLVGFIGHLQDHVGQLTEGLGEDPDLVLLLHLVILLTLEALDHGGEAARETPEDLHEPLGDCRGRDVRLTLESLAGRPDVVAGEPIAQGSHEAQAAGMPRLEFMDIHDHVSQGRSHHLVFEAVHRDEGVQPLDLGDLGGQLPLQPLDLAGLLGQGRPQLRTLIPGQPPRLGQVGDGDDQAGGGEEGEGHLQLAGCRVLRQVDERGAVGADVDRREGPAEDRLGDGAPLLVFHVFLLTTLLSVTNVQPRRVPPSHHWLGDRRPSTLVLCVPA